MIKRVEVYTWHYTGRDPETAYHVRYDKGLTNRRYKVGQIPPPTVYRFIEAASNHTTTCVDRSNGRSFSDEDTDRIIIDTYTMDKEDRTWQE